MVNVKAQRYPTEKHGALRPPAACKTRYILGQRIPMQTVTSQFLCETRWFWADRTLYRRFQCEALTTHSHVPQQPSGQVFVAAAGALQLGHKSESITWILAESSHIYRPAFWQEKRTWIHCHSDNFHGQLQPPPPPGALCTTSHSLSQQPALPSGAVRAATSLLQRSTGTGSKEKSVWVTSATPPPGKNHAQFDPVDKRRQFLNWSRGI